MGKKGPPYKHPDDAQWIVVLKPPHIIEGGQIDYEPLAYWLRAIHGDQPAAKFVYEIQGPPDLVVIVELPAPQELPFPKAAYGQHDLRRGLKRRPWFEYPGETVILPYNFEKIGHPEDTKKLLPVMFGPCDNEWHKLDLTIPYPTPQPFEFGRVPHRVVMFCRRPPDPTPPPPDSMEIEHYPTQEPQRVQNFQQASQPRNEQPLFIPEDDSKPKIKNLDPHEEEESISSFLRGTSKSIGTTGLAVKPEPRLISVAEGFNANENHRESNTLPSPGDSRLTVGTDSDELKQELANQDDAESQRIHEMLQRVNRSPSPSTDDRLAVKRELENQDETRAREMFKVLEAANREQGTRGDGPGGGMVKRDLEDQGVERRERDNSNSSRNTGSGPQVARYYPAPNRDRDRDGSRDDYRSTLAPNSNYVSWRDRDERGGRERGGEREREKRGGRGDRERGREEPVNGVAGSDNRKRYFAHSSGHNDRGSGNRREYPDKRSRANYQ